MRDTIFISHATPENDEFIGIYRNATSLAFVIAPIIASILFFITPSISLIYVVLAIFMLYGAYLANTIERKDI